MGLWLGCWDTYFCLNGLLSDVRVWKGVRTAAEIAANKNQRLLGNEANLVAYWPLNDGTGSAALDKTGNGFDGTLVNNVNWESALDLPL